MTDQTSAHALERHRTHLSAPLTACLLPSSSRLQADNTLVAQLTASTKATHNPAVRVLRIVDGELVRIIEFVRQSLKALEATLTQLFFSLSRHTPDLHDFREAFGLREMALDANAVGDSMVELDRFARLNILALRKICKKVDKVSSNGDSAKTWLEERLEKEGFSSPPALDALLSLLSDVHSLLRQRRDEESNGGKPRADAAGPWRPPTEFERSTDKYWVKPEDVPAVMVKILRQIPVLIMHRPPAGATRESTASLLLQTQAKEAQGGANEPGDAIHGTVSSLYLDSPELSLYHERIVRGEGARLYRLRWYGLSAGEEDVVFVERKTHRGQRWTGSQSSKERFPLEALAVGALLRGACDIDEQVARMVARGRLREEQASATRELGADIQAEVVRLRLQPTVRTVYRRCAFQRADSNAVRVTIDSGLSLVRERPAGEDGGWCYPLDASLGCGDVIHFPFTVLEVKLQCETPQWVEALLATGLITPANKFSKYLTGCASFFPRKVRVRPSWLDEPTLVAALGLKACCSASGDSLEGAVTGAPLGSGARVDPRIDSLAPRVEQHDVSPHPMYAGSEPRRMLLCRWACRKRAPEPLDRAELGYSAAEGKNSGSGATRTAWLPRWSSRSASDNRSATPTAPLARPVDPKTIFALERTFIQWISVGVLLFSIGLALMDTGAGGRTKSVGYAVLASASALVIYALLNFYRRASKLARRDTSGYVDEFGPAILVAMLIAASVTYMCVEHVSSNGTSGSDDDLDTLSDLLNTTALREAATKLEDAKLSLEGLKDVLPDTLLINSLLVAADIQAPGDRLAIINALMKSRNA